MKTYQEFNTMITEAVASVTPEEFNKAADAHGAGYDKAFKDRQFRWELAKDLVLTAYVSKSRTSKKKTAFSVEAKYSIFYKDGKTASGFDNVESIVKEADAVKASLKGKSVDEVKKFLKAEGWKKIV